ncbi:MAG: bifunctional DNA primase/polymerase, partial [Pseudonocardiaceae bacterium]
MSEPTPQRAPTPYRDAAHVYRDAGWLGVIPIPVGTKVLRKVGWTGRAGAWPSISDVHAWCGNTRPDEGGGNIALRLPPDVIGIDVDAYDDKPGAATLAATETRYGPLPPTWRTTSRDDGISGIRLFRIPEGLNWPGQVGPGVETVHTMHRYAMVWPSLHPKGRTYRWITPRDATSTLPPRLDDIPDLPDEWIIGLTGGQLAEDANIAELSTGQTQGWILGTAAGPTCRAMQIVLQRLLGELQAGSAHESLRRLLGLTRLAEQGHIGLIDALAQVHTAFLAEVTTPNRSGSVRDKDEADHEWQRSLAGAVRRVVGNPSVAPEDTPPDPCVNPFAGLVTSIDGNVALAPLPLVDPAPAQPTPPATTGISPEAAERTTWWPRDLGPTLSGEQAEPAPTVLARQDSNCLFYAGKVNGILGESESGKTWVLLAAVVQELDAGHAVLYV